MEPSVRVHGLSGGVEESKLLSRRHFWILQGEHHRQLPKVEESKFRKRQQLCVLRGEHARNIQGSRNHNSKNDEGYAFYKEQKPVPVRC